MSPPVKSSAATSQEKSFKKYATEYDPIKIASIDGTDTEPHDRGVVRALRSEYRPSARAAGDPRCTVFVARLHPRTTQAEVESQFAEFGRIVHCRLVKDIVTGKSKRYAFVTYAEESGAERAARLMHGQCVERATLLVEREAARRLPGWRPRCLGGGFGGNKESGQLRFGCIDRPFRRPILVQQHAHRD